MAALNYRNSLSVYRRYLQLTQEQPLLQASLFLIFSLVLVIVLVFSALRPTLITISGLLGSIKAQREIESRMSKKILDLTQAQQLVTEVQPLLGIVDEAMPNKNKFETWSSNVEKIAANTSVQITQISSDNTGKFTLVVGGQYPDLYRFLNAYEGLRRISLIDSVQITKANGLTLTITGVLPTQNDQ